MRSQRVSVGMFLSLRLRRKKRQASIGQFKRAITKVSEISDSHNHVKQLYKF